MAKRVDPNQLPLDFSAQVEAYIEVRSEILEAIEAAPVGVSAENEFEACIEIAAACKKAYREARLSREQLVDGINAYFGRSDAGAKSDPPICRKPLSIDMLNNYLSKPTEYPLPAYLLYAIHHVTGCLEPARVILAAEGAQVATAREVRLMQLGKLEETLAEMQRLRREIKAGQHG
ncbi:MAG: hypothetical protein IH614_13680 [Desulfuromonadales bacterium]|nr:hypothetical protein [Desulfuromonadales bacterium]